MENKKTINIVCLNPEWVRRTHPLLRIPNGGGHRAKAGEWFLEVQRVTYDIYKTFVALEHFLNRGQENLYVGENKDLVSVPESDRVWTLGYLVENGYLRIGSCLDKIAQMARIYYEHPDHGGKLLIHPRCGNCPPEELTEANCSFGALVNALHKEGRVPEVDSALFALEKSEILSKVKKARNDITHRINKTIFNVGLDPDVDLKIDGDVEEISFTLGKKYQTPEEYRQITADAHNEIVMQLNIIGPIIFPEEKNKN